MSMAEKLWISLSVNKELVQKSDSYLHERPQANLKQQPFELECDTCSQTQWKRPLSSPIDWWKLWLTSLPSIPSRPIWIWGEFQAKGLDHHWFCPLRWLWRTHSDCLEGFGHRQLRLYTEGSTRWSDFPLMVKNRKTLLQGLQRKSENLLWNLMSYPCLLRNDKCFKLC